MSNAHDHESFTLLAIEKLKEAPPPQNGTRSRGRVIHTVYSGFNAAFRTYFNGDCPVEATKKLHAENKISLMLVRGGAYIAARGVLPERATVSPHESLEQMGL